MRLGGLHAAPQRPPPPAERRPQRQFVEDLLDRLAGRDALVARGLGAFLDTDQGGFGATQRPLLPGGVVSDQASHVALPLAENSTPAHRGSTMQEDHCSWNSKLDCAY